MKNEKGLTLIELVIFIVLMSIIAATILAPFSSSFRGIPSSHQANIMTKTAERCMEWFLGQRYAKGFSNVTCPNTTVPTFCSAPSGYTVAVNVACVDTNSTSITVKTSQGSQTLQLYLMIKKY